LGKFENLDGNMPVPDSIFQSSIAKMIPERHSCKFEQRYNKILEIIELGDKMIKSKCISWKDLLEISAFLSKRRSTTARCPSELAMCWSDITCHLGSHPSHPTSFSYSI
jgi:hypothetical protein